MPAPDNTSLYRTAAGYRAMMAHYDAELARLTIPHETRYIDTRYGATHVTIAGDTLGLPVVLLHGLNAHSMTWRDTINRLAGEFRVYAPDVVGQAGRSAPTRPPLKGHSYGRWVVEVLDALKLGRVCPVGISQGGWLTLQLAAVAPERIMRAFLMSSAGLVPSSGKFMRWALWTMLVTPRSKFGQLFVRHVTPPHLPVSEDDVKLFTLLTSEFRTVNSVPPALSDEDLRKLSAPTLLLMGEHEVVFDPRAAVERAKRAIPGLVSAEIVPGVGHGMTGDNPDLIHTRMIAFLRDGSA